MDVFYREWLQEGSSKAEALRQAQRTVRRLTAGQAIEYAGALRGGLDGDPHAQAYVDLTVAEILFHARDYAAARDGYEALLEREGLRERSETKRGGNPQGSLHAAGGSAPHSRLVKNRLRPFI